MSNQDGGRKTGPAVIPAEAVEAAAKGMCAAMMKNVEDPWSMEAEFYRDHLRNLARAALEAAAPYIRAQALEDAATAQGERVTAIEQTLVDEYQYDSLCSMREQANQDLIWLTERAAAERTAL